MFFHLFSFLLRTLSNLHFATLFLVSCLNVQIADLQSSEFGNIPACTCSHSKYHTRPKFIFKINIKLELVALSQNQRSTFWMVTSDGQSGWWPDHISTQPPTPFAEWLGESYQKGNHLSLTFAYRWPKTLRAKITYQAPQTWTWLVQRLVLAQDARILSHEAGWRRDIMRLPKKEDSQQWQASVITFIHTYIYIYTHTHREWFGQAPSYLSI